MNSRDDEVPFQMQRDAPRAMASLPAARVGLMDRLLRPFRSGNGKSPPTEAKAFPLSGIQWVGGSGPFSNASIHWLNGVRADAVALDRATAFAISAYCYTAMLWRMEHVAEPPLMVVRETEEGQEWQPEHPLAELFDAPRPDLELSEIIARTVGYRDATGAALWFIDRDLAGRRRRITPFSQAEFKSEPEAGLIFGRYSVLTAASRWTPVPREDVIHFREPNPFSWREGTSRVDVALAQLNLGHTVNRITHNFLRQAMFPGGVLSPDKDWHPTPEEWEQWKAIVEAWQAGPANAGVPLALQGGTTFSRTASGMADLLPDAVLDRVEATVGSVFGTPPVVLGWLTGLKNSPWSQMSEARRQSIEDTIQPLWADFGKRLTRGLLTPEERKAGLLVVFDTSQVRSLAVDEERDARIAATNSSLWTVDEGRLFTGMDKLPEGDPRGQMIPGLPTLEPAFSLGNGEPGDDAPAVVGDSTEAAVAGQVAGTALNGAQVAALLEIVTQVTMGTLPISAAEAIIVAAFPLLTPAQIADIFEDVEEGMAVPVVVDTSTPTEGAGERLLASSTNTSTDTRDLLWLLFDLHSKASEAPWTRVIADQLVAQRKAMVAAARENLKSVEGELTAPERKRWMDEGKAGVPQWITRTLVKQKPKFVAVVYPLLVQTGGKGVRRLAARLKLSFSVLQPGLLKYARRESAFLVEVMGKTTGQAVAAAVQKGLAAGETIAGLAQRLETLPDFDRTRAKMVARTETTRAWNGAQRTSLSDYQEESGNEVFKSWLSARDDRVRDEHAELDDESEIPVNEPFANGLMEPGEPNCRCSLTYRVATAANEPDIPIDEPSEETE